MTVAPRHLSRQAPTQRSRRCSFGADLRAHDHSQARHAVHVVTAAKICGSLMSAAGAAGFVQLPE